MGRIRAAIFDLDGTLVDSLGDIGAALTAALAHHGLPAPTDAALRQMIGEGARVLVERAVADRADPTAVLAAFRDAYRARPIGDTCLYDGVAAALDELTAAGLTFAIVSNKPHELTRHLAERLFADWPFAAIYGARPELPLKPDPTQALCCADELGVAPGRCAFIGDSAIDVATGRAAAMRAVGVSWGFRPRAELEAAAPDALIDAPAALAAAILVDA
ncbi:MAG: HAD family hydrolase [Myxococcales bacterium]|nr:HAD family hydrolase [Myxococcales bacterium]